MRISEDRKQALYGALNGPIMSVRLDIARADSSGRPLTPKQVDGLLYHVESRIWDRVQTALGIDE